jgi:hypothetical protein
MNLSQSVNLFVCLMVMNHPSCIFYGVGKHFPQMPFKIFLNI